MSNEDRLLQSSNSTTRLSVLFMIVFACLVWIRFAEHSHSGNSRRKLRFSSSSSSVDVDENVELPEEKETEATEKEIESSSSWIKGEESSGKNSQFEDGDDGGVRSTVTRCYDLLNDIDSRIGRIFLRVFGRKNNHGTTAATIVAVDNDYDDTAATAAAATAIVVDSDDS